MSSRWCFRVQGPMEVICRTLLRSLDLWHMLTAVYLPQNRVDLRRKASVLVPGCVCAAFSAFWWLPFACQCHAACQIDGPRDSFRALSVVFQTWHQSVVPSLWRIYLVHVLDKRVPGQDGSFPLCVLLCHSTCTWVVVRKIQIVLILHHVMTETSNNGLVVALYFSISLRNICGGCKVLYPEERIYRLE